MCSPRDSAERLNVEPGEVVCLTAEHPRICSRRVRDMHREKLGDGGRKLVQLGHGLDVGKGDGAVGEEDLDDAKVERIVLARARVDATLGR